jgi:chromosome partitioning protein
MAAKVYTIAQQKGGAGKTTLAAHLAVAWAADGKRVALVDIDPQGSLAAWDRARGEAGGTGRHSLTLIAVSGWRLSNEIERVSRDHDIVIVDSPPHAETEAKLAVRAAKLVVIPVQPSPMDVWATQPTIRLASEAGTPVLIVLNRVPPRGKVIDQMRQKLVDLGWPVASAQIGNRIAFAASMLEGLSVIETAHASAAAAEIRALASEIAGHA